MPDRAGRIDAALSAQRYRHGFVGVALFRHGFIDAALSAQLYRRSSIDAALST
jgi:hypothetical protein